MADVSFKQAKDIVERLELAELSLKSMLDSVEEANSHFEQNLQKQKLVLDAIPRNDKKITFLKVIIGLNIGFIFGVIVGKYFL